MDITKNLNGGVLEIAPEGRIDTTTAADLESVLKPSLTDADSVVLDCSKLEYISSAGLRVLLSANKSLVNSGKGPIKVINASPIVQEVFEVTGFSDILDIE